MSTPQSGLEVVIKVNTGTILVPVWTEVAFQRGATINRSADTIDTSHKSADRWKTFVQGLKEWSLEAEGLYVLGGTEFDFLEDAFDDRDKVQIQVVDSVTGEGFTGYGYIVDFPIEAPYDAELTYSITIQGTGALTSIL